MDQSKECRASISIFVRTVHQNYPEQPVRLEDATNLVRKDESIDSTNIPVGGRKCILYLRICNVWLYCEQIFPPLPPDLPENENIAALTRLRLVYYRQ